MGCHQHDAIRAPVSVDGSLRGTSQHRDAADLSRRERAQHIRVRLETVYDQERFDAAQAHDDAMVPIAIDVEASIPTGEQILYERSVTP